VPEFRVTVLGCSPAWANPGGACSGYLVSSGDDHVLVECGFGVLSRLRQRLPLDNLRAVVISHLHADHFMDLVPLRYGLKYGGLRREPALKLIAPPGAVEFFGRLGAALDGDQHFFDGTYNLQEYRPGASWEFGSLSFTFHLVKHYIPSYAMRIEAGRVLAFSADAAPCRELEQAARGADLFLCEAAIFSLEEDDPSAIYRGHLTAAEAAAAARAAGVQRLLLTHYRHDPERLEAALREARAGFSGPVEYAQEGRCYKV
jgi:ribonuclease BN (tRNA processing enzyme)